MPKKAAGQDLAPPVAVATPGERAAASALLERRPPASKRYKYDGTRRFFCGIKDGPGGENHPPCHRVSFPVPIRYRAQSLIAGETEDHRYAELSPPTAGEFLKLTARQVNDTIAQVKRYYVRWAAKSARILVRTANIFPGDEPLADYIVMYPAKDMTPGDHPDPNDVPSLGEQFPECRAEEPSGV